MSKSKTAALETLLYRIELMARHEKLTEAFGLDWMDAASVLNASGLGAASRDPVLMDGGESIDFDVTLLEPSKHGKTGYAGVYANGSSFRALVPDIHTKGSRYLQSRPTPVRAAIDRYEHFMKWGIPYGNIGRYVEEHCGRHLTATVMDGLIAARLHADASLKYPFTSAQLEAAIVRHREASGLPPEKASDVPGSLNHIEATREPEMSLCGVCKAEIEGGHRFSFIGSSMTPAHTSCLDFNGKPLPREPVVEPKASMSTPSKKHAATSK